jgi:4'-phosphopantetheinyl transferase EntD
MQLKGVVEALANRLNGIYVEHSELPPPPLEPAEVVWTTGMTAQRAAQFARGRGCARAALRHLGCVPCAIPLDADMVPVWPDALVGSISHKVNAAVAAAAFASTHSWLGIDLELDEERDEAAVADRILTPMEALRLDDLARTGKALASPSTLVLCAKEAAYKAAFPSLRLELEWQDVEIRIDPTSRTFRTVRLGDIVEPGVQGAFELGGGWLLALAWK